MECFFNKSFSSSVNKLEIEMLDSAYVHGDREWNMSGICSPYSRMYFIESGGATITAGNKQINMEPGYVYIIPTGLAFSGICLDNYTKVYFHFCINRPDGYDLFSGCNSVFSKYLGSGKIAEVKRMFFSENLVDTLKLKSIILDTALSLFPEENSKELLSVIYSPQVQRAIDYIKSNLSIQLSVKTLSENLFVAQTTLSKHFHDEVGVNIGRYIDDIVFESAKKMLIKTDIPIQTISEKFGFCDRFYFSRRFKEKFGFTPYRYRKMNTTTFS